MRSILVPSLAALVLLAAGTGCAKKTKTTTDPDLKKGVAAPEVAKGLPSPDEKKELALKRVHFEFDEASITSSAKPVLDENAKILKEKTDLKVRVEGHCDERGSTQYNLALSERRAHAAKQYLTDMGVPANRIETVGYGKEQLLDKGNDESAHARNRRAEMVVVSGGEGVASSK